MSDAAGAISRHGSATISFMAQQFSFDVTSSIDLQEVDNAVNQARKELGQRYDFKGSPATIELDQKAGTLTLTAEDAFKLGAVWEIVQTRLVRRNVPVKNLKPGDPEPASAGSVRQVFTLQQGIPTDASREIVKFLKDAKMKKVQASIQGDQLRISAPSKDDLQAGDGAPARAGLRRRAAVRQLPLGTGGRCATYVPARGAPPRPDVPATSPWPARCRSWVWPRAARRSRWCSTVASASTGGCAGTRARLVVPERAALAIDEVSVAPPPRRTIALHKPRGVVTTRRDPEARPTVYELIAGAGDGLAPAGRLDMASTGLLVCTNDTQLAAWLTDPAVGRGARIRGHGPGPDVRGRRGPPRRRRHDRRPASTGPPRPRSARRRIAKPTCSSP